MFRCAIVASLSSNWKRKKKKKKKRCKSEQKRKARTDKNRPTVFWHPLPPPLRTGLLLNRKHYLIKKKKRKKKRELITAMMILVNLLCVTHTHSIEHLGRKGKRRSGKGRKRVASLVFEAQEKKRLTRENQKKEKRRKRKTDELNYVLLGLSVCFLVFFFFPRLFVCLFSSFFLSLESQYSLRLYKLRSVQQKKKKYIWIVNQRLISVLYSWALSPRPLPLSPHTKKKKKRASAYKKDDSKRKAELTMST